MRGLDGCTIVEMYSINRLSDKNQFGQNFRDYIQDFRKKLLGQCEDKFDEPIEGDLEALNDKTREIISSMEFKIVDETDNDYSDCQLCQLISNSQFNEARRSNFDPAYQEFIGVSCREFIDGMGTIEKVFRDLRDKNVDKAAGKQKRKLADIDFCYMAADGSMPVEVYKLIKTNAEANPTTKRSLLDKFRLNKCSQ